MSGKRPGKQRQQGDDGDLVDRAVDGAVGTIVGRLPEVVRIGLGNLLLGSFLGIIIGFLLLFGGVFLAVAWSVGPQPLLESIRYAPYTAKTTGRIVESWAAIDFDPAAVPEGKLYWQTVSRISPCVVVEYSGDWGAASRRGFCGNRFTFREDFRLDDWTTMAPGVPFAFTRDASGFAVPEIRLGKPALGWLSTHAPRSTFLLSKPPPANALGALREQFDRPLDVAQASWSTPFPQFPLAYDPAHPESAMPAQLVEDRRHGFWWGSLIFTVMLCVPGLYIWRLGVGWLTGQSGMLLWLITLLPLLALPWWGDVLPMIIARANANWAEIASDMLDDISRVTRFTASAPADLAQAGGERLAWHVESGAYADTFGRIRFTPPQPPPKTPDAALQALREQASAGLRRLPPAEQLAVFRRLREQYENDARQVQPAFTLAGEDVLRDPDSDPAVRRVAKDFLIRASGGTYYQDQLDAIEQAAQRGSGASR
jgi:hypothetical protein